MDTAKYYRSFRYIFCCIFIFQFYFCFSQNAELILKMAIENNCCKSVEYSFKERYYNSIFNENDTFCRKGYLYQELNSNNLRSSSNYLTHVISFINENDSLINEYLFVNDTLFSFHYNISIFDFLEENPRINNFYVRDKESYTKFSPLFINDFYKNVLDTVKQKNWNIRIDLKLKSDTIIDNNTCYQIGILTENGYLFGHNIFSLNDSVKSQNRIFLRKQDLLPIRFIFESIIKKSYTTIDCEYLQLDFTNIRKDSKINFMESTEFRKSTAKKLIDYRIYLQKIYGIKPRKPKML